MHNGAHVHHMHEPPSAHSLPPSMFDYYDLLCANLVFQSRCASQNSQDIMHAASSMVNHLHLSWTLLGSTYSYIFLKGIDFSSGGILTVALEVGEEVAGEEGVELEEQVVH